MCSPDVAIRRKSNGQRLSTTSSSHFYVHKYSRVLVVGGAIAGMSTTIMLRRIGCDVTLIDLDPDWRVAGAETTFTGTTIRTYERIGILERGTALMRPSLLSVAR
jgi:hypothetical protein